MRVKKLKSLLHRLGAQFVVLLCHQNADPDALCSAFSFSQLLHYLKPDMRVEIAAAQGPSKLSKQILRKLPIKLISNPNIERADALFLLDTNTLQQLAEWKQRVEKSNKPLIMVDHHAMHPGMGRIAALYIADETASSTCEIIYALFREAKIKLCKRVALALFLGIAYDSKHFSIASSRTFKIVSDLIDAGVKAEEALSLLLMPMDVSERIARIKAAHRIQLTRIGEWLIAASRIGAYQASVARALVGLGAHVAIAGGEAAGKLQFSLRSSRLFYEKTGVHLGRDISNPLGEYVHGMGGGHSTAAGVNGEGDLESAFKYGLRLLRERITK